jgi:hypothetical protein
MDELWWMTKRQARLIGKPMVRGDKCGDIGVSRISLNKET